jgi:hypothetical protein
MRVRLTALNVDHPKVDRCDADVSVVFYPRYIVYQESWIICNGGLRGEVLTCI